MRCERECIAHFFSVFHNQALKEMEIQTKHLPHYQFKYYKLKCVVIGQLIVLLFYSSGKDAAFGSGCSFRGKNFAEWFWLIFFSAEIKFQIFSLPDSPLSFLAEMIVTQTLLTVCALQGWPRIILCYSHKPFIIFIKSHRFLP